MEDIEFVPKSEIETCSNNLGFEYERKVTVLTALSAALNFEDFELNTNVWGYTPLDDIVLKSYKNEQETLYLVQIKHVAKPAEIQDNFFFCKKEKLHLDCVKRKGHPNFCLNKYNSKYNELTQSLGRKIYFKFYTNYQCDINNNENCTFFLENKIEEDAFTSFLNTSSLKQTYKLHENKPVLSSLEEEFRKNSSFFFNQQNVDDINDSIIHLLKQFNISEDLSHSIFGDLIHYFDNICSEIHKRPKITKKLTLTLVYFSCLFYLKIPVSEINTNNNFENTVKYTPHLWNYLKKNKVILRKKHLGSVQGMIFNHENLTDNNNDVYINILFKHKKFEFKSSLKNYFVECFRSSLPFLIENQNYKKAIDILKNFNKFHVIFVDNSNDYNGSKFEYLSSDLCKELLGTEISQLTRKTCLVKDILATERDLIKVLQNVTVSDFLAIYSSSGFENINKKVELERFVYFNEVGTPLNELINNYSVVFVNCNFSKIELVKHFNLTISQNLISISEEVPSDKLKILILAYNNYKHLSDRRNIFKYQNILFVEIINQKLILKDYLGSIEGIKFLDKTNGINLSNIPNFYQNNNLIIFSGVPGIGKSTAMNQLATHISSQIYVSLVNLGTKHQVLNELSRSINCLETLKLLNNETNSFYLNILEYKYKKRDLCVIFDGYDEIAPNFVKITNTLVKCILKENIRVILTTRTVLESQVEKEFFSKSLNLKPFDIKEQTMYLEQYFSKQNLEILHFNLMDTCKGIIDKITNNKIGDEQFYSVPLHLEILSQVLLDLFKQNQTNLHQIHIDKLHIYKRFIGTKIKAIQEKSNFNIDQDEMKEYHQYFALKEIFPDIKVPGAEEYLKVFTERLSKGSEKAGILVNHVNNMFIHRTVAEYYVALWLMENVKNNHFCQQLIKDEIFKKEYQFINEYLNSLLYSESSVYRKIKSEEYDDITQEEIDEKYSLDRNIFHLLIINLDVNTKSKFITSKLERFLKRFISKHICFKEEDFFQLTPINYAEKMTETNGLKITIMVLENNFYFYFNQTFNLLEFMICKNITTTNNSRFRFTYGIDILLFVFEAKNFNFIFFTETFDLNNNKTLLEVYKYGFNWLKNLGESINNLHCRAVDLNSLELSTFLLENYNDNYCGGNINDNPLYYAFLKTSYDFIKIFVENKIFLNNNVEIINKFIKEVIIANNDELIEYLINKNLSTNELKIYSSLKQKCPQLISTYKQFLVSEKEDKLGNSVAHLILLEIYDKKSDEYNLNINDLLQLLECLIENEYNINAQNINGKTIIDLAIQNDDLNTLTYLINSLQNSYVQYNNRTYLKLAVLENNLKITHFLLVNNFNLNAEDEFNDTPLHWAVRNENLEMVKLLIKFGANINASNNQQRSPLHIAAETNKGIEITNILLEKRANIEARDSYGNSPLLLAILHENLEIVKILINSRVKINTSNNQQLGPLHIAAETNKEIEVTKILLEKAANVEALNSYGSTPLLHAIYFENFKIVKLLIDFGANINTSNNQLLGPLHLAAETNKEIEITKILLEKAANVEALNSYGSTPLLHAVYFENLKIVKLLIDSGGKINTSNNQQLGLLHIAAETNKEMEVTKILLEKGANIEAVNSYGSTPLLHAVYFENLKIVKLLINSEANINTSNNQQLGLLHIAAETNKEIEVTKLLLEDGANIEAVNSYGSTPLLHAVYFENLKIVKLLINSGAKINTSNNQQQSLLHVAVETNKEIEVTKILLEKGANIEAVNSYASTPLLHAVYFENLKIVKLLINFGAKINTSNNQQLSPLHIAIETNKETDVIKILLEKGANIEAVNSYGSTPLLHAVYFENLKIVKFLINSGAKINTSNHQQLGPLHVAIETNKETELTKTLLEEGANIEAVNSFASTPLLYAVQFENLKIVKLLINFGAKINSSNNQQQGPLHIAVETNKEIEVTKILLEKGANIEAVNSDGTTPLLHAVYFESLKFVELLINSGAKINIRNNQLQGPLHIAAQNNKEIKVTKMLLQKGADIEAADLDGNSPLLHAVTFKNLKIIILLLQEKANINVKNQFCKTPLHIAVEIGALEILKVLLEYEPETNALDINGNTPLNLAIRQKENEMIQILREFYKSMYLSFK